MDDFDENSGLYVDTNGYYREEICPLTGIVVGQKFKVLNVLKCECGMNATYGENNDIHSDYCPLYNKPRR